MSVVVSCRCRNTYTLKDEYAGQLVECPQCGAINKASESTLTPKSQADETFNRDVFLLRQKHLAINQKYQVSDEQGNAILYVERPTYFWRTLFAVAIAWVVMMAVYVLGIGAAAAAGQEGGAGAFLGVLVILAAPVAFVVVAMALSKRRHVTFYRDESKTQKMFDVLQDKKVQFPMRTYTVRDASGKPLASFKKNYLYNIFRKRWEMRSVNGTVMCVAKEDSIILSLLRRVLGPLFGLLRTNFLITRGETDMVIGEFKRKFTILDRYVLDLSPDHRRDLDRRLGLALGVMLDTGERR
ncbi:MAG TPA: hypothetical protein VFH14_08615 [Gemmatimonadaceae bacterium]|jgi:uncharacterized protein YxjI|nr:hypothetical protein [Gemmatimonadaceae bacterium]